MSYKLKFLHPANILGISKDICRFLPAANPSDVKIILYLYSYAKDNNCFVEFDENYIMTYNILPETFNNEEIHHALNFWNSVGILDFGNDTNSEYIPVSSDTIKHNNHIPFERDKRPSYTSENLADATEIPEFSALLDYTEKRLNKMLNPSELAILYSMYDYLSFSPEVIMLATEHCISEGKRSLRYIEKLLLDFADKNIITYEAAEDYINKRKHYKSTEGKVRILCGLGERSLTKNEKTIIGEWADDPEFDFDLLKEAYDITIQNIGKPTISYINKILIRWKNDGIDTLDKLKASTNSSIVSNNSSPTYDLDKFFIDAVEKERK